MTTWKEWIMTYDKFCICIWDRRVRIRLWNLGQLPRQTKWSKMATSIDLSTVTVANFRDSNFKEGELFASTRSSRRTFNLWRNYGIESRIWKRVGTANVTRREIANTVLLQVRKCQESRKMVAVTHIFLPRGRALAIPYSCSSSSTMRSQSDRE